MATTNAATTSEYQFHTIIVDENLGDNMNVTVADNGSLVLIDDETVPEDDQKFVSLTAAQAATLRALLNRQDVLALITEM